MIKNKEVIYVEKALELSEYEKNTKKQLEFFLEHTDNFGLYQEEKEIKARLNEINKKEKQIMFNKSKKSWNDIINNLEMSKDYDDEEDLLLNLYDPNKSLPDIESSLNLKLNLPPNPNNPNEALPLPDWDNFVEIFEDWQIELKAIDYLDTIFSLNFLQFSIQQQEKHYNDIINGCNKFKAEHPELNSCDASKRFIFTNICQHYPIFLKYLSAIGAIRVYPNNFTYYNPLKNRFYDRSECFTSINQKIDFINYVSQCLDAFSDCFKAGLLWNLLNAYAIVDTQLQKQKKQTISSELRWEMIRKMKHQIRKEISKKIEKDTGIEFISIEVDNISIFTDVRTERISIYINTSGPNLRIKIHGDDGERNFLSKEIDLQFYSYCSKEDKPAELNKILAEFSSLKKDFTDHILAFENYAVVPLIFLNPNFNSKIFIIKDLARATTADSITCNIILALLAKSSPDSFKYIDNNFKDYGLEISTGLRENYLDNYTNPSDRFYFEDVSYYLYEFYKQIDVFSKGYIEEEIKNGKKIYRVYSDSIFTKDHIPKIFLLISMLSNIDKVLAESKEELSESTITYLKKWPDIFKKLPEEIQRKYINFATKSGFDNSIIYSIDPMQFYEILTKDYGFTNIEFFRLNFALRHLGDIFGNMKHACKEINDYFKWALNGFKTSKVPTNKNKLFDNVIQYFPKHFISFPVICDHINKNIDFAILDVNTNEIKTISKAIDRTIYDDPNPNYILANETKIVVAEGPQQNLIENLAPIPKLAPTSTHHSHDTI